MIDRKYCACSYLMYRYVIDRNKAFSHKNCEIADILFPRDPVSTAEELLECLDRRVHEAIADRRAVLALSGGIDSAILAKFMPKGSKAYTFRCIVPGKYVTDETGSARRWADICGLEHEIVDIYWEDIEQVVPCLMEKKGAPIHSIEAQIYIAAKRAKTGGADRFIFGENADIIYGGMNRLLEKDWLFSEFVDRYTYVMPYKVLKDSQLILDPYLEFERDGYIDGHDFINKYFRQEALGTYQNACNAAEIQFVGPYSTTYLNGPIDYSRIRNGETKYLIREAFRILYPNESVPKKIPMPRPMNEWFADWGGPQREEFLPHCTDNMSGDQKWMVWALERYFNLIDSCEGNIYV